MNKGQSQIVSAIVIVLIGLGIVGTVLPWASSVIQKKKDAKSVEDVYNFFKKLDSSIVDIARNGGEESLELNVPGKITVYPESYNGPLNNSIVFMFNSKVSNVADSNYWVPLNTPNDNYTATLGIDRSGVIFAKSDQSDDENLIVWYRLWFRELEDTVTGKKYKIKIYGSSERSSTQGFFRIQKIGSDEIGNLIKTEVNIIV